MKDFTNVSMNGFPNSNLDQDLRGQTRDNMIIRFHITSEGTTVFFADKQVKATKGIAALTSLEEAVNYLMQVAVEVIDDQVVEFPIPLRNVSFQNGLRADCPANGCAAHGGCIEDAGCLADGCAAHGGCVAKSICSADGCAAYGGCAADAGCVGRGCVADGGCGANVPCGADACVGHACGVDACPANVNVGPCAIDIPVCPIIL